MSIKTIKKYMGCSSVVENLPNMHEALNLIYNVHVYAPCMCIPYTHKKRCLLCGEKKKS